ncbi:netrin receptor UNC5B-b-like isoform X2 [Apostichopus japonicus]|uniref:netrin receptor UNC5B-b-like isoform X2 n=1 Tax=Stichopus japonicus TaxID=307972 RepID=UPI003AB751BC
MEVFHCSTSTMKYYFILSHLQSSFPASTFYCLMYYYLLTGLIVWVLFGTIVPAAVSPAPVSTSIPVLPVILEHPQDVYVVRSQSVDLTCTAQPASQVYFSCNGELISPEQLSHDQTFDEYKENKMIKARLTIGKRIVPISDEGIRCLCQAWNDGLGPVNSDSALVKPATLDRFFIRQPLSNSYPESLQPIELYCSPPDGDPTPETYWQKDGERIDTSLGHHYILSHENSLIINQPAVIDSGNYTCVAANIAYERISDVAKIRVYVSGEWGLWSSWSSCDPLCGDGVQTRRRKCSNPMPESDREDCIGSSRETQPCHNACPTNGRWGEWSDWYDCNAECQSIRVRSCDSPSPANGGRDCRSGAALEKKNCTGGLCADSPSLAELIPVYIGIGLAFFVIVMSCIFMLICFMSRRKRHTPMYPAPTTTVLSAVDECNMAMLTMQPDITQTSHHAAFCTHVRLPNESDKPNGFHHSNSYLETSKQGSPHNMSVSFSPKNGAVTHLGGYSSSHSDGSHYSLQNGSMKSNTVHTYVPLVGPGSERHYCTASKERPSCYDRCHLRDEDSDFYSQQKDEPVYALPIQSSESSMGPESEVDTEQFQEAVPTGSADSHMMVSGRFGPRGGRLIIPEAGVSLFIPDGAITRNNGEEVYLGVNPDPSNQPNISPRCTSLTPVVVAGPPGITFNKPVILTIPHCSQRRDGDWRYSIYSCNMAVQQEGIWERLVTAGEETINTPVYVQVDSSSCSVILDQLGSFVLMGESAPPRTAGKRLRLATFGPALRFNMDYTVKVYVTDDTPDAIERVVQLEQKFGGALLHRPKLMEFQDDDQNLRLSLDKVMQGWQCKPSANFQEIPFFHVWSGTSNTLHCSFTLAREDPSLDVVGCRIHITQGQAQTSLQVLDITRRMEDGIEHQNYHNSPSQATTASFETPTKVFRLPRPVRARLCTSLDPPRPVGNDWRLLAAKLGVDGYINFFATKPSPTDQILDLWEARCREDSAVATLTHLLREMGRNDAVAVLEQVPWM